jgi:AcrR family transcriptional regulator
MDTVNMIKPSNYHHGNLREKILQTAFKLLDDEGIESIGIRKIARILDVAHSAPANHFKNKQALLTALATESFQHLVSTIEQDISPQTNKLRIALHSFCTVLLEFGLAYPNRYKLLWRREYADNKNDDLDVAMEAIYSQLTAILKKHAQHKQVDVESQAIALWALIHGYVLLRLDGNLNEGVDEVTGIKRQVAIIDVLIDGIAK